jgi:DNA-directed RNA polymerase delta subunit
MKKYDKEYQTQFTPEKEFLANNGVKPSFVKVINEVTTYKYIKTSELFNLLAIFYAQK